MKHLTNVQFDAFTKCIISEAISSNPVESRHGFVYRTGIVYAVTFMDQDRNIEEPTGVYQTKEAALNHLYVLGYTYFNIRFQDGTTSNYVSYDTIRQLV